MKVKIKRLHENSVIPKLSTAGSACVDVVATKIIDNLKFATVFLGFSTAIPEGYKAVIAPRSSFTQKGWILQNTPCQIDADYRGEWMLKFEAIPIYGSRDFKYYDFPYKPGDRVAQVWIEKVLPLEFEEVEELESTERGSGGFGSTGK